jgi:hypothetical protein
VDEFGVLPNDIHTISNFKGAMAVRFERAMWAAWIPHHLKHIARAQEPAARTLQPGKQPWLPQYYSAQHLRNLKPGYYYIPGNPDYVMRVYEDYEKPGRTLEKRLEYLKVIKSKDYESPTGHSDQLRQLKNFGTVTSKSEIKKLIAWAPTELETPYRQQEFKVKTRDHAELYIKPLA